MVCGRAKKSNQGRTGKEFTTETAEVRRGHGGADGLHAFGMAYVVAEASSS